MSHTARPQSARRPRRRAQALIWVLFAATLLGAFTLSGLSGPQGDPAAPAVPSTATHVSTTLAAPSGIPAALVAGRDDAPGARSDLLKEAYGADPTGLLPAFRWSGAVGDMNNQLDGVADTMRMFSGLIAGFMFMIASWIWTTLLSIVSKALSVDLVNGAAGSIDTLFVQASHSLGASGFLVMAVVAAIGIGALRTLRGKGSQAISIIVGATLVVGTMSFMTAAANQGSSTGTGSAASYRPSTGSPADLAVKGNDFVNTVVAQVVTGFGSTDSLTSKVTDTPTGSKADTAGATCDYYMRQMLATYSNYAQDKAAVTGQSAASARLTASTMKLLSFMWQRSMYDNWTTAVFGNTEDGARAACHQLENNANIDPLEQFALVGGGKYDSTATLGPYAGMAAGPFFRFAGDDNVKTQQSAMLAWAACGPDPRPGWQKAGGLGDGANNKCKDWRSWAPSKQDIDNIAAGKVPGPLGINTNGGEPLEWGDPGAVEGATVWNGQNQADKAGLDQVREVTMAYFGYNAGERFFAGLMAILASLLYAWAFGAAALGTILAQLGLLFLLGLLPYTLMLLAFPTKDGGRNPLGKRLMKLTVTFMAGKAVFVTLLAVTLQLMAIMYGGAQSFTGTSAAADGHVTLAAGAGGGMSSIWSLIVPGATIFILTKLTKMLGMGNLMSPSGAAGFATSAVMSGKENRKARSDMQGSLKGALSNNPASRASKYTAKRANRLTDNAKGRLARRRNSNQLSEAVKDGKISPEQAGAIAAGRTTLAEAKRAHALTVAKNGISTAEQLTPDLVAAVTKGTMTKAQALKLAGHQSVPWSARGAAKAKTLTSTFGGIDGGRARAEGLGAAAGATDGASIFMPVAGKSASHDLLARNQTERRTDLAITGKNATEGEYKQLVSGEMNDVSDLLRFSAQTGEGRRLTAAEASAAAAAKAAELGVNESDILMGTSGFPPLLAPLPRHWATGRLILPPDVTPDVALLHATNPLNYLDIQKMPGQSASDFHQIASLAQYMTGAADEAGRIADFLKAHGADTSTVAGKEEILKALKGQSSSLRLEDIKLTLHDGDRRAISAHVKSEAARSTGETFAAQVAGVADVKDVASAAAKQAVTVQVNVNQSVQQVASAANPVERDQALARALRTIEDVPTAVADMLGVALEAQVAHAWMGNPDADTAKLAKVADRVAESSQSALAQFQDELLQRVVAIKETPSPDTQLKLLNRLRDDVAEQLAGHKEELSQQVKDLSKAVKDQERGQRQQQAAQMRPPRRGSEFAAGATSI